MDFHVFMLIFYFMLALGVSFMCSLMEAAILSLPRSHAVMLRKQGKRSGVTLEKMKRSIDRPLAAILTLNTISHTVGAAGVGAEAYVVFEGRWIALTSAILTLAILVLSEIIPKTIGAVFCRQMAPLTAMGITVMIYITYPIVIALEQFSRLLPGGQEGARLTREELALLAEMGQIEGAIEGKESRVIQNLLKLRDFRVHDVMTPRKVVQMIQQDHTVGDALTEVEQTGFSRFPLFGKDSDELVGIVLRRDLSDAARRGDQHKPVKTYARELRAVPESASVDNVLWRFFSTGHHMFQVVDEYGGTAGIVTLEDAIETMLGTQIVDETDRVVDMRRLAQRLRPKNTDSE